MRVSHIYYYYYVNVVQLKKYYLQYIVYYALCMLCTYKFIHNDREK